jgi:hypothetical protein
MAAVNARDVALAATSPRTIAVTIPGQVGWPDVTDPSGTKAADNADVTVTTINGGISVTGGGITLSAGGSIKGGQTAYATGTGWFLGYSGAVYKFSIGSSSKFLTWDGTSLTFAGDLSGAGTINWTGSATFTGTTAGAVNACVIANASATVDYGVYSPGKIAGVRGDASGVGAAGVYGNGGTQIGVKAEAATGISLQLKLSGAGKLIEAPASVFSTGATTPAFTNKPSTGTTVKWIPVFDAPATSIGSRP